MEKKRTYSQEFKLKAVELSNLRRVIGASGVRTGYIAKEPGPLETEIWRRKTGWHFQANGAEKQWELENIALRKALRGPNWNGTY